MSDSGLGGDDRIRGGTQISVTVLLGAVLLIMGIVGFISGGQLLVFGVNPFHNAFHVLTGVLAIAAGLYADGVYADEFNKAAGIVYGLLVIFQVAMPGAAASLLNANTPDIWLHVGLAFVFGGVGFALPDREREDARTEAGGTADRGR